MGSTHSHTFPSLSLSFSLSLCLCPSLSLSFSFRLLTMYLFLNETTMQLSGVLSHNKIVWDLEKVCAWEKINLHEKIWILRPQCGYIQIETFALNTTGHGDVSVQI